MFPPRRVSGVHRLVAAAAAALFIFLGEAGGGAPSATGSDTARGALDQPLLAVSAYSAPSSGREIQLVGLDGQRVRLDPHPPLPIDGSWSPDGERIVFSGGDGPPYALDSRGVYTSDSRGTHVRLLYAAATDRVLPSSFAFLPSWSPDGKWVAFSLDGLGPWVVGADGRGARRVANLAVEGWIAWSPDGTRLAFAGRPLDERSYANDGVYTVRVDGTRLRRLTRNQTRAERASEAGISDVSWAPDGRRIAFTRYWSGPADEIEVVNAGGRNERRVARGAFPVWSPDGGRLAFAAEDRSGRSLGIDVIRADGGSARVITKRWRAWSPAWTADGRRIVFMVDRNPYVADANGRWVRRPSPAERRHIRLAPTASQLWSTDGKLLANDGDFDENWYVVRVLTLRGTLATFRWSDDSAPEWSPDGQQLAFVRLQKTEQIFVLDTVGKQVRRLAAGRDPAWSPDGKWIAFEHKNRIFVVPAGGGSPRPIGSGGAPAWSPDSRWIAAAAGAGLYVLPRDGGTPRRVDQPGQNCSGRPVSEQSVGPPAWSHDGRALAFGYWVEACQEDYLAVVTSDGTSQRFIAPGGSPQWSPDDTQIAFLDDLDRLLYIPAAGGASRVLAARSGAFSLASDGRLVAYVVDTPRVDGTDVWLVQTDGSGRQPLLQGGSDSEPVWRP